MKALNNFRLISTLIFSLFLSIFGALILYFTVPRFFEYNFKVYEATIIKIDTSIEEEYPMVVSITLEDGSIIEVPASFSSDVYKVGNKVKVLYSPESFMAYNLNFTIIILIIGIVLILSSVIVAVVVIIQHKKTNTIVSEAKELSDQIDEKVSEGFEGEKYDFHPQNKIATNYQLDYRDGDARYEAICEKNRFLKGYEYAFKDKETGFVKRHKISVTVTRSSMELNPINYNSCFKIDGVKIWDYFKSNQITIKYTSTKITNVKYAVYNRDELIGLIESSSPKNGIISAIEYKGYYRITTKDDNIRIMFLVAFTLARIDGVIV